MYIILEVEPHQPRTHFTGLEINIFDLKMVVKSGQEPELLLLICLYHFSNPVLDKYVGFKTLYFSHLIEWAQGGVELSFFLHIFFTFLL